MTKGHHAVNKRGVAMLIGVLTAGQHAKLAARIAQIPKLQHFDHCLTVFISFMRAGPPEVTSQ